MWLLTSVVAFAFAVTSTTAVWRCKEGWDTTANKVDNFKTIYDNCHLFYIFGGVHPKISYGEARAYCQDNGGNLATFQSQDELTDFLKWISEKYSSGAGKTQKAEYTLMLGYAYLREGEIDSVYESVAGAEMLLESNTKWTSPEGVDAGDPENVVVVKGRAGSSKNDPIEYEITEMKLGDIGEDKFGFVCKRPKRDAVCSKLNKPYVSTFGGRRVPIRPYSRYYMIKNPVYGNIIAYTYGNPKAFGPEESTILTGGPKLPSSAKNDYPRHGPQISYVEFTVYYDQVEESSVKFNDDGTIGFITTSKSWTYGLYRAASDLDFKANVWMVRRFNADRTFTIDKPVVVASQKEYPLDGYKKEVAGDNGLLNVLVDVTVRMDWFRGGSFGGGWMVTTPGYRFFYDGFDIQIFNEKTKLGVLERGLCDTNSKDQSYAFFFKSHTETTKTTDIFEFAKGQSLANHLSLVGVGRPYSCTSHALHEGAIKECYDLINPISPLRSFSCFSKALDIDIGTGAGFQPSYQNIYQACIESICAHGPAAKCYYIDKLISKIQQSCPTTPPNILSDIRKGLNCDTPTSICKSLSGTSLNGICYFVEKPEEITLVSGHVMCTRVASQLPAPANTEEGFLVNILKSASPTINEVWIGVMTSMKPDVDHAVAFKKVVAMDEAAPLYIRSTTLEDDGNDQCIKLTSTDGKMPYTSCTEDSVPALICSYVVSDPACPAGCMYPKQCVSGSCNDPCPGNFFEMTGKCIAMM